jgi:hypothetical protein
MRRRLRNFLRAARRAKAPIYDLTRGLESFARALYRPNRAFLVFFVFVVSGQLLMLCVAAFKTVVRGQRWRAGRGGKFVRHFDGMKA